MPDSIRLLNPTDESLVRELPLAGTEEVDAAIARARQASPAWQAMGPADRARLLRRFADTVGSHADELAQLETANMGMPIGRSTWLEQLGSLQHTIRGGSSRVASAASIRCTFSITTPS